MNDEHDLEAKLLVELDSMIKIRHSLDNLIQDQSIFRLWQKSKHTDVIEGQLLGYFSKDQTYEVKVQNEVQANLLLDHQEIFFHNAQRRLFFKSELRQRVGSKVLKISFPTKVKLEEARLYPRKTLGQNSSYFINLMIYGQKASAKIFDYSHGGLAIILPKSWQDKIKVNDEVDLLQSGLKVAENRKAVVRHLTVLKYDPTFSQQYIKLGLMYL